MLCAFCCRLLWGLGLIKSVELQPEVEIISVLHEPEALKERLGHGALALLARHVWSRRVHVGVCG